MQQKVYVVCDNGRQAAFQAWAERSAQAHQAAFLGGRQILTASLGSTTAVNQTAALTAFAAVQQPADMLIVIDGTNLCEPGFSLQRFIQHAVVRNKDSVAFCTLSSQQGGQQVQLQLDGSAINPRVTNVVQPDASSTAAAGAAAYMAPLFAFTSASVPKLVQSGEQSLSQAVELLLESEQVYALPVQCSFDVSSLDGYLYADAFFTFYQQRWKLLHGQAASAQAKPQVSTALPPRRDAAGCASQYMMLHFS